MLAKNRSSPPSNPHTKQTIESANGLIFTNNAVVIDQSFRPPLSELIIEATTPTQTNYVSKKHNNNSVNVLNRRKIALYSNSYLDPHSLTKTSLGECIENGRFPWIALQDILHLFPP